jgi:hypothetical protein
LLNTTNLSSINYEIESNEKEKSSNNYPILLPPPRLLRGPPCGGSAEVDEDGRGGIEDEAPSVVAGILYMATMTMDGGGIST